jgi:hypothetical protein
MDDYKKLRGFRLGIHFSKMANTGVKELVPVHEYFLHGSRDHSIGHFLNDQQSTPRAFRDLIGNIFHRSMLDAFADKRDCARIIRLAKHLAQSVFNDYLYEDRAKELIEQLARRSSNDSTI